VNLRAAKSQGWLEPWRFACGWLLLHESGTFEDISQAAAQPMQEKSSQGC
jgi:hypothetical protein